LVWVTGGRCVSLRRVGALLLCLLRGGWRIREVVRGLRGLAVVCYSLCGGSGVWGCGAVWSVRGLATLRFWG